MIVELRPWHRCTRNTPGAIRLGHMSTSPVTTLRSVSPMSCALTLFDYNPRSGNRSKHRNSNTSRRRDILSYPARIVELLRSMDMKPRSWVVELTNKLEELGIQDDPGEGYRRSSEDHEEWSNARPISRRTLHKDSRPISSPRPDRRGRPSQYSAPSPYRQEPFRSPPLPHRNSRSPRGHDSTDRHRTSTRERNQTPWPSSPRRDFSEFQDRNTSPESRTLPEHSLRRGTGQSVGTSGHSKEPSVPSMQSFPHVPSLTYRDASHIRSSRSRGTNTPPFPRD
jgi:hypothetical protein